MKKKKETKTKKLHNKQTNAHVLHTTQPYIQKVKMYADFAFQSKKSAEKVRKFSRQNFATKVRKS